MKPKTHPERIAARIAKALNLAYTGRLIHHATREWPRYHVSAHGPHHVIVRPVYPLRFAPARPLRLILARSTTGTATADRIRKEIKPRYRMQLRDSLNERAAAATR